MAIPPVPSNGQDRPVSAPRARRASAALLAAAVLLLCAPPGAFAGITGPALALGGVVAQIGDQSRSLQVHATFPGDDIIQRGSPIQLVVFEEAPTGRFVRYDLSGGAWMGSHADLGLVIDEDEGWAVVELGAPEPSARVTHIDSTQVVVKLPDGFPGGRIRVQLVFPYEGEMLLSNPAAERLP